VIRPIPNSKQISNLKPKLKAAQFNSTVLFEILDLSFEIYLEFVIWCLGFICYLGFGAWNLRPGACYLEFERVDISVHLFQKE